MLDRRMLDRRMLDRRMLDRWRVGRLAAVVHPSATGLPVAGTRPRSLTGAPVHAPGAGADCLFPFAFSRLASLARASLH
jgi:hypothetical protein